MQAQGSCDDLFIECLHDGMHSGMHGCLRCASRGDEVLLRDAPCGSMSAQVDVLLRRWTMRLGPMPVPYCVDAALASAHLGESQGLQTVTSPSQ